VLQRPVAVAEVDAVKICLYSGFSSESAGFIDGSSSSYTDGGAMVDLATFSL
jgi:hypothetical protein